MNQTEIRDKARAPDSRPDYTQSPDPHSMVGKRGGEQGKSSGRAVCFGVIGKVAGDTHATGGTICSSGSALLLLPCPEADLHSPGWARLPQGRWASDPGVTSGSLP